MKPSYFEKVRAKTAKQWDQLDEDKELAGPWHQLFKQVQSPRHVISELLQNADDAGATAASVQIEGDAFTFEHNGEDFKEEHFASLCRFGYSNKRALHTIGFRGIGFKSTFSIGDRVELDTPSLAVDFVRSRFTEPIWAGRPLRKDHRTSIRVTIKDAHRRREIEKNMAEWVKSALSLLFFRNIRRLTIGGDVVEWRKAGPGPVADSAWMALNDPKRAPLLIIRSAEEPFPEDALAEIRQERMLTREEDAEFPPARVELVLGGEGQLFVVLPTGVKTKLPVACNAPFIQDPARLKIKDPETSPTNRWLLERAGRLAYEAMLGWVGNESLTHEQRAQAYGLWPDVDRDDPSLEGLCGSTVEVAFEKASSDADKLFLTEGDGTTEKQCVVLPPTIHEVWPGAQGAKLFDNAGRPALSAAVSASDRAKLVNWGYAEEIDEDAILRTLCSTRPPKPKSWRQLLTLWGCLHEHITSYYPLVQPKSLNILPVQGDKPLRCANDTARLGEKKLLASDEDWTFLDTYLVVLNPNWVRFLADERLAGERDEDEARLDAANDANEILFKLGLNETSQAGPVIERVASQFFSQASIEMGGCVRLAQIAAKLGVQVGPGFRFVTRDRKVHPVGNRVLIDASGELEELLPEISRDTRLLHGDYMKKYTSCTKEEWASWVASGKSGLLDFMPVVPSQKHYWTRTDIQKELKRRGVSAAINFHYVTDKFIVKDWDFSQEAWKRWQEIAPSDATVWWRIVTRLLSEPKSYWNGGEIASAVQESTTGSTHRVTLERVAPAWAMKLRELPCVQDMRGRLHVPGEVLRRTEETEPYLDVEPFIPAKFDREGNEWFWDLIGIRSEPAGPRQIVERLRALTVGSNPPPNEVDKWYRRLDQVMGSGSSGDADIIRKAFESEKLILADGGGCFTAKSIYQYSDEEDVPGVAAIRTTVRDLALWRRVGVAERPTVESAIAWLKELKTGKVLTQDEARRIRSLLRRFPLRIWDECGHWVNLANEWAPTSRLTLSLTMQALVQWKDLYQGIKQKTADVQGLTVDVLSGPPFSELVPLGSKIDERPTINEQGLGETREWTQTLGEELARIDLSDEAATDRVRQLATKLSTTSWLQVDGLQVVPYIDGTPAGSPRHADAVWRNETLYVDKLPKGRAAKRVPEEIGRAFDRPDIKAALDYSFERSGEDIRSYLRENFKLAERTTPAPAKQPPSTTRRSSNDAPEEDVAVNDPTVGKAEEPVVHPAAVPPPVPPERTLHRTTTKPPSPPKPARPALIEQFAATQGFRKNGDGRFLHPDGSCIIPSEGAFPWQRVSKGGDSSRYYWLAEHCLERQSLQLDAAVWDCVMTMPQEHSLVLVNGDDKPIELTGARLREWVENQKLRLYPSSYRLAMEREDGQ